MAISLDTTATSTITGTTATSKTYAHTCAAGTTLLTVCVSLRGSPTGVTATYNGVSMTSAGSVANGVRYAQIFTLNLPATGSNNVVVSWTGACCGAFCSQSWFGTGRIANFNSATGTATAQQPSVAITSKTGDFVIDCVSAEAAVTETLTVGAGQTQGLNTLVNDGGGNYELCGASREAGASSVTMSWAHSNTPRAWATCGISLVARKSAQVVITG